MKATSVSKGSVTFTFNKPLEIGHFITGDCFVIYEPGALLVSATHSLKPNVLCELDPQDPDTQGLYNTAGLYAPAYVPSKTLALPYALQPGIHSIAASAAKLPEDIVQPNPTYVHEIQVLTTLDAIPVMTAMRPPYCGNPAHKQEFMIDSQTINLDLLTANRPIPAGLQTLAFYTDYFAHTQYEYFTHNAVTGNGNVSAGSTITPSVNIRDRYGADRARFRSEAFLRASEGSVPLEQRKPLLLALIQLGIDTYYAIKHGQASWVEAGGHGHGRWLPVALAAWALQNKPMYEFAWHSARHRNAPGVETYFEEFAHFYNSSVLNEVLFGMPEAYGKTYWTEYGHHEGAWLFKDPLERIDGGDAPGSAYHAIITAALTHLIFCASFNTNLFNLIDFKMVLYCIRYATRGAITLPDPSSSSRPTVAQYDRRRDYGHASLELFAEALQLVGAPPISIKKV